MHNVAVFLHTHNFDLLSDNSTYQPYENRNILIIFFILFLDISTKKYKIRWSDEGYNFTGIPLIIAGTKLFACQYEKNRKPLVKEKKKKKKYQKKARNYEN